MKPKYLYHGSSCGTIKVLEPRISLEFKSFVYATNDIWYALIRAGQQKDLIREEYYGPDEPFELAECYPDAFKQTFGYTGYIYVLDSEDFYQDPVTHEYKSEKPVEPVKCISISNIYTIMKLNKEHYDLHYYGDDAYWKTVRGGLNGFLERKRNNKRKMMEMRKARA